MDPALRTLILYIGLILGSALVVGLQAWRKRRAGPDLPPHAWPATMILALLWLVSGYLAISPGILTFGIIFLFAGLAYFINERLA
jgi:hypothetical protein